MTFKSSNTTLTSNIPLLVTGSGSKSIRLSFKDELWRAAGLSAKGKPIRDVGPFLRSFFSLSPPRLSLPSLLPSPPIGLTAAHAPTATPHALTMYLKDRAAMYQTVSSQNIYDDLYVYQTTSPNSGRRNSKEHPRRNKRNKTSSIIGLVPPGVQQNGRSNPEERLQTTYKGALSSPLWCRTFFR